MSDTPRTDAHNKVVRERGGFLFPGDIDFMRELERENARLRQVSGELCEECGWAMKFPGEPCRCDLERENIKLRAQVLDLAERMNGHSCTCSSCSDDERTANKYREDILLNHHPLLCPHCKQADVEIVKGDAPWTIDHWQCPSCDSTYADTEFSGS
jgi:hypothetical protein